MTGNLVQRSVEEAFTLSTVKTNAVKRYLILAAASHSENYKNEYSVQYFTLHSKS